MYAIVYRGMYVKVWGCMYMPWCVYGGWGVDVVVSNGVCVCVCVCVCVLYVGVGWV